MPRVVVDGRVQGRLRPAWTRCLLERRCLGGRRVPQGELATADRALERDGMVIVPAPGLTNHDTGFNGISAFSPSEAVAVGFSNTGAGYRPLADSWDGASWQLTALPSTLRSATLVDVAMLGHGDAWAVGKTAKAGIQKPVLVHWDGSAWTTATAPNIGGALLAVTATPPSGAWAVGYRESPHGDTGVVMRFDGTRWTDVTPPAADGMVLADVSADAAGEVWVVGYTTLGSSLAPVAWPERRRRLDTDAGRRSWFAGSRVPRGDRPLLDRRVGRRDAARRCHGSVPAAGGALGRHSLDGGRLTARVRRERAARARRHPGQR